MQRRASNWNGAGKASVGHISKQAVQLPQFSPSAKSGAISTVVKIALLEQMLRERTQQLHAKSKSLREKSQEYENLQRQFDQAVDLAIEALSFAIHQTEGGLINDISLGQVLDAIEGEQVPGYGKL